MLDENGVIIGYLTPAQALLTVDEAWIWYYTNYPPDTSDEEQQGV